MKKITFILLLISGLYFTSCDLNIQEDNALIGTVFEIEGDFRASNDYTLFYEFPQSYKVLSSDIVLVYILWKTTDGLDVWRLLPQTVAYPEGVIQYNFDFTVKDVEIFMEGTIPAKDWLPGETDNQVFRIVVMPAGFFASKSLDISDMNKLMNVPGMGFKLNEKVFLPD